MEIGMTLHHSNLLVQLQGELDHHWSDRLREVVDRELERYPVRNVVFNLQGVSFMDSSGVGMLLGRYRRVHERGGRMAICGASDAVSKVLEISGIPRIVPLFSCEAEALEHMVMGHEPGRRSR